MNPQNRPDGVFSTSRQFPFTAARLLAAFADKGLLATWWGPAGFRNTVDVFEFRPQGRWVFVMHGPDGTNYPNESRFLETGPNRIVIRHESPPLFTLTVTLTETDGHTRLDWQQAFDDPDLAARLAHIVVPSNEQNLDRLDGVIRSTT